MQMTPATVQYSWMPSESSLTEIMMLLTWERVQFVGYQSA